MTEFNPITTLEMPVPMGVEERTGALLPVLDLSALSRIEQAATEVLKRGASGRVDRLAVSDVDPNNLRDAGWGLVFGSNADPAVINALQPLIEHRRQQICDSRLLRVFAGQSGYQSGDTVRSWLVKSNVGFAVVDPLEGVPLYLTIVGGPDEIPFEFQYLLDTYWNVGRLAFDTADNYAEYVQRIINYENAQVVPNSRQVAIFAPKNIGDRATGLFHDLVAQPLAQGEGSTQPVGVRQNFKLVTLLGDNATKQNLVDLWESTPSNIPALLFSGSHGNFLDLDESGQRERQGAIVCQDWAGGPVGRDMIFAGEDLNQSAKLDGSIHLLFACYGGGCPEFDNFRSGTPRRITHQAFVARLPQQELLRGALAVIAHIDRAWSYSFLVGRSAPQRQEFRDVMIRIMRGERVGQATDMFNLRWAILSAELADDERNRALSPNQVSEIVLANRWVARNDARNYILFGDPAVRLRVEAMVS